LLKTEAIAGRQLCQELPVVDLSPVFEQCPGTTLTAIPGDDTTQCRTKHWWTPPLAVCSILLSEYEKSMNFFREHYDLPLHSADFKPKVAVAVLRGDRTLNELA
jgi:hypothetical protein